VHNYAVNLGPSWSPPFSYSSSPPRFFPASFRSGALVGLLESPITFGRGYMPLPFSSPSCLSRSGVLLPNYFEHRTPAPKFLSKSLFYPLSTFLSPWFVPVSSRCPTVSSVVSSFPSRFPVDSFCPRRWHLMTRSPPPLYSSPPAGIARSLSRVDSQAPGFFFY